MCVKMGSEGECGYIAKVVGGGVSDGYMECCEKQVIV